jgi:molybdopterin/thiamine biosynthesis adenylyltransferase
MNNQIVASFGVYANVKQRAGEKQSMTTEAKTQQLDFKNDRDATLKLIDWFDIECVRSARFLVVGAGAIGNEVLKNLALLGVGHIYIFDRDTIELSNLSRSVLYRAADNGQPKAATAARAVRELNPAVNAYACAGDIRFDLGEGLLRRMDVVIGCLDNREARQHLNQLCWKLGRPWIDAGIGQLNGQVQVFRPGDGPCYECAFSDESYEELKLSCNELASLYAREQKMPTTPTIASLVAAVQVQEALKLLDFERWEGRSLVGREFTFNGTVGYAGMADLPKRPDCPVHFPVERELIVELPELRAAHTTAAQLLAVARARLGPAASISLNFELAVERRCAACQTFERVLRPKRALFREQLRCLGCDEDGYLVNTHVIGGEQDDYREDFLDCTLAELGVPALDLLHACGADGRELYLELTGDAQAVFNFEA